MIYMRVMIIIISAVAIFLMIGIRVDSREANTALAYSCGYLARTNFDAHITEETDFCKKYRLSAIARGFNSARDAYPEEAKP